MPIAPIPQLLLLSFCARSQASSRAGFLLRARLAGYQGTFLSPASSRAMQNHSAGTAARRNEGRRRTPFRNDDGIACHHAIQQRMHGGSGYGRFGGGSQDFADNRKSGIVISICSYSLPRFTSGHRSRGIFRGKFIHTRGKIVVLPLLETVGEFHATPADFALEADIPDNGFPHHRSP